MDCCDKTSMSAKSGMAALAYPVQTRDPMAMRPPRMRKRTAP
jgi:hypothetical protein